MEFLLESCSLLHLDLADNRLDLTGVMALSKGIQGNWVLIHCLNLNVPSDDEEFALYVCLCKICTELVDTNRFRLAQSTCHEIQNTCIWNMEEVGKASNRASTAQASGKGVWGHIEESKLARSIQWDEAKVLSFFHCDIRFCAYESQCRDRLKGVSLLEQKCCWPRSRRVCRTYCQNPV